MALEKQYKAALAHVNSASGGPSLDTETKLQFYALYKQITEGPCTGKQPSRFRMTKYYKWKAWNSLGKMSKDDAMKAYIAKLREVDPAFQGSKL